MRDSTYLQAYVRFIKHDAASYISPRSTFIKVFKLLKSKYVKSDPEQSAGPLPVSFMWKAIRSIKSLKDKSVMDVNSFTLTLPSHIH